MIKENQESSRSSNLSHPREFRKLQVENSGWRELLHVRRIPWARPSVLQCDCILLLSLSSQQLGWHPFLRCSEHGQRAHGSLNPDSQLCQDGTSQLRLAAYGPLCCEHLSLLLPKLREVACYLSELGLLLGQQEGPCRFSLGNIQSWAEVWERSRQDRSRFTEATPSPSPGQVKPCYQVWSNLFHPEDQ